MMRIGVDLGGTKISAIAMDERGNELLRKRIQSPRDNYDDTIAAIRDLVLSVEAEIDGPANVGMGIPGAISPATGVVKNANSTWLIGHPLDRDLSRALGRVVRVENDANCLTVSEATDGAAAGAGIVFGVIIGTGVGGGVAINGRPLTGADAIAGEWGHNPLPPETADDWPGPPCYCGRHGCIETRLSGPGMEAHYTSLTGERIRVPEIVRRSEAGEDAAETVLGYYERGLARGLGLVVNVLDPHVIVLGGGVSNVTRLYESVPRYLQDYVFSDRVVARVVQARNGDDSGVRGAVRLWQADEPFAAFD